MFLLSLNQQEPDERIERKKIVTKNMVYPLVSSKQPDEMFNISFASRLLDILIAASELFPPLNKGNIQPPSLEVIRLSTPCRQIVSTRLSRICARLKTSLRTDPLVNPIFNPPGYPPPDLHQVQPRRIALARKTVRGGGWPVACRLNVL